MIREARVKKKLTHARLGEILNVSPSYISALECGNKNVNLSKTSEETLILLTKTLKLDFRTFKSSIPAPKTTHPEGRKIRPEKIPRAPKPKPLPKPKKIAQPKIPRTDDAPKKSIAKPEPQPPPHDLLVPQHTVRTLLLLRGNAFRAMNPRET